VVGGGAGGGGTGGPQSLALALRPFVPEAALRTTVKMAANGAATTVAAAVAATRPSQESADALSSDATTASSIAHVGDTHGSTTAGAAVPSMPAGSRNTSSIILRQPLADEHTGTLSSALFLGGPPSHERAAPSCEAAPLPSDLLTHRSPRLAHATSLLPDGAATPSTVEAVATGLTATALARSASANPPSSGLYRCMPPSPSPSPPPPLYPPWATSWSSGLLAQGRGGTRQNPQEGEKAVADPSVAGAAVMPSPSISSGRTAAAVLSASTITSPPPYPSSQPIPPRPSRSPMGASALSGASLTPPSGQVCLSPPTPQSFDHQLQYHCCPYCDGRGVVFSSTTPPIPFAMSDGMSITFHPEAATMESGLSELVGVPQVAKLEAINRAQCILLEEVRLVMPRFRARAYGLG